MIQRIGLVHTVVFLADMFGDLFKQHLPDVDIFHMVDEAILKELMAHGHLTPSATRRIVAQSCLAEDAGADLIVFTCSSTSPAVDGIRPMLNVPIMKIDDPMAEKAVDMAERIGVITTAKTTEKPSVDLIRAWADQKGKRVEVRSALATAAFDARLQGNIEEHDRIVRQAMEDLAPDCDVIVLAQASMAHLADVHGGAGDTPVLSGPSLCIDAIKSLVANPE
jgi:Asp/Glu/hydantoin racemase